MTPEELAAVNAETALAGIRDDDAPPQRVWDALEARDCRPHGTLWDFRACCPGHDGHDDTALSVCVGADGRAVLHCFTGCDTKTVVDALGLDLADLFPDGHRHARRRLQFTPEERRRLEATLPPEDALELVEAAGRTPRAIDWLWQHWIPIGALTGLAGVPDAGKSTFSCWIAARVTRGEFDGALHGQPRNVLIASLEDTIDQVLVPRLIAAGADLTRVAFVRCRPHIGNGVIDLTEHLSAIEAAAEARDAALIIIDPLVAALGSGGKLDSHRDQQVRSVLARPR
jgi:hypothetical protein